MPPTSILQPATSPLLDLKGKLTSEALSALSRETVKYGLQEHSNVCRRIREINVTEQEKYVSQNQRNITPL